MNSASKPRKRKKTSAGKKRKNYTEPVQPRANLEKGLALPDRTPCGLQTQAAGRFCETVQFCGNAMRRKAFYADACLCAGTLLRHKKRARSIAVRAELNRHPFPPGLRLPRMVALGVR